MVCAACCIIVPMTAFPAIALDALPTVTEDQMREVVCMMIEELVV